MNRRLAVKAPAALLFDPALKATARLTWFVARLCARHGPSGPAELEEWSGLSRPTILRALTQLTDAGWYRPSLPRAVPRADSWADPVHIPGALLTDRRVGVQGRLLYGALQATPGFEHDCGQFTYPQLEALTGVSANTLKLAVKELTDADWLFTTQKHRLAPVAFTLYDPVLSAEAKAVSAAAERIKAAPHKGEALMKEYLTLLIEADEYKENFRPGFLTNPTTGEALELDRYYPALRLGFEFNGDQHAEPVQQGRDLVKSALCAKQGVTLVTICPQDLRLNTIHQRLLDLVPTRPLTGHEALTRYLEQKSERYRQKHAGARG